MSTPVFEDIAYEPIHDGLSDDRLQALKPVLLENLFNLAMYSKSDLTRIQSTNRLLEYIDKLDSGNDPEVDLSNVSGDDLRKLVNMVLNNDSSNKGNV